MQPSVSAGRRALHAICLAVLVIHCRYVSRRSVLWSSHVSSSYQWVDLHARPHTLGRAARIRCDVNRHSPLVCSMLRVHFTKFLGCRTRLSQVTLIHQYQVRDSVPLRMSARPWRIGVRPFLSKPPPELTRTKFALHKIRHCVCLWQTLDCCWLGGCSLSSMVKTKAPLTS